MEEFKKPKCDIASVKRLPSVDDDFDDELELELFDALPIMEKKISKKAEALCK